MMGIGTDGTGCLLDGSDFSVPIPSGPLLRSLDKETRAVLFRQKYMQLASTWKEALIGSVGPNGSFLTDESAPSGTGVAGIVEWTRNYAQKPPTRTIPQEDTHNYQFIDDGKLQSVAIPCVAMVTYTYYHVADPTTLPLQFAYVIVQVGTTFVSVGTVPSGSYMLGADEYIEQWRGNWWRKVTKMVPTKAFS